MHSKINYSPSFICTACIYKIKLYLHKGQHSFGISLKRYELDLFNFQLRCKIENMQETMASLVFSLLLVLPLASTGKVEERVMKSTRNATRSSSNCYYSNNTIIAVKNATFNGITDTDSGYSKLKFLFSALTSRS